MSPASDIPYIAFEGDRCIAVRRSPRRRARGQGGARPAQGCRRFSFSTAHSGAGRYRFSRHRRRRAGAIARPLTPPSQRKTLPSPRRAVPAGRNSAWSRARSRCCRGTGNGWRSNPGGASVALRRLVDEARRANKDKDRIRQAREAAYRFMSAMGEQQAALRGSGPRAVRRRRRRVSRLDRGLARRRARPRPPACRDGVRTAGLARTRCRLIPRM